MTQTKEHIYFIGIGGISMSGLAEILASRGHQVSGTDVKETAVTKHLQSLGHPHQFRTSRGKHHR